jgi:hypothetical protein
MEPLQFLPWDDLAESSSLLVLNVFLKEGYRLGGAHHWVRSSHDGGFDDIPGLVGATIHLNPMLPLFQSWRERVHIG